MSLLTTIAPDRRSPRTTVDPQPRPQTRPPLRLVEPPAAPRPRVRVGVVGSAVFFIILVGVFALAAVHTLVVQAQFELDQLDQSVAERQGELDELRLHVATLESPASITAAAADLGLVTPADRVYLEPVVTSAPPRDLGAIDESSTSESAAAGQLDDGS